MYAKMSKFTYLLTYLLKRNGETVVVVVVTFFNHNFVNCKATLILAIKFYEIKYNISLNNIHT